MNKSAVAYTKIKQMIMDGILHTEQPLSENKLVEEIGVSRTPIRAALQRLQHEGFLQILPNQGIVLHRMSLEEAREKYDLRIALELHVLRKSFPILTEEDMAALQGNLCQQKQALTNKDEKSFLQLDDEFHRILLYRHDNVIIVETIANLRDHFYPISLRSLQRPDRMRASLEEHTAIYEAIQAKNLYGAQDALEKHIENGVYRTLQMM